MSDGHDLVLREGEGENPPDLLEKMLRELAAELASGIPEAASSGRRWLAAKADEQSAKARLVRAAAVVRISAAQLANKRLVAEREKAERDHELGRYRAETERIKAIAEAAKVIAELRQMGVEIDLSIIQLRADAPSAGEEALERQTSGSQSATKEQDDPPIPA